MWFYKIVYLSFSSVIILFILTKIMGRKEMAQLSMFDYIVSITIGSIAAEMATSLEDNFWEPLIAMVIYAIVTIIISILSNKFLFFRRLIFGNAIILLNNGRLYRENFKKAKLDINEFLAQCRTNGYFNINEIQTAILESNGKISFIPKSAKRQVMPEDLGILPKQEGITVDLIIDGKILKQNLLSIKKDEEWLKKELNKQGTMKVKKYIFSNL